MTNIAILANALKDINIIEIIEENFILFVLLGFAIRECWKGLKFCLNMIRNQ